MAQRDLDQIKQAAENLTNEQLLDLAQYLLEKARKPRYPVKKADLSEFYGKIEFPEDALEYQQRIRAEWDR